MKKRYWLRGGVIISSIGTVLALGHFILWGFYKIEFLNIFALAGVPAMNFTSQFGCSLFDWDKLGCKGITITSMMICAFIVYFLFGATIGWLYGKIKNRSGI